MNVATDGRDTLGDLTLYNPNAQMWSDICSLVPGRLDNPKWSLTAPLMAPRMLTAAAVSRSGARSLLAVNYDQRCPAGGGFRMPFTVPDGVTAICLHLGEVALWNGNASGPIELTLLDATGSFVLHTTSFQPATTSADVRTPSISVVSGVEYIAVLTTRTAAGHAVFRCGRLRVIPTEYTDPFWASFTRVEAHPALLGGTNRRGIDNPRYWRQSQFATMTINTDASEVRAEYYDSAGRYLQSRPNSYRPAAYINGDSLDPLPTVTSQAVSHVKLTLPYRGVKTVEINGGIQVATIYPAPHTENIGTFLAAVYVPATAAFEVARDPRGGAEEHILFYGDSKIAAFHTSFPAANGPAATLRRRGYRVTCHCAGGASLFADAGATLSVDACKPIARELTRGRPDRIVLEMGRNDFANGRYTPANLVTQLGNLLDAIAAVAPGTLVDLLTFTREVTEDDVSSVSWETERANIAALAASRAWVTVRDTARAWTKAQATSFNDPDGTHPNDAGYERIVTEIVGLDAAFTPLDTTGLVAYGEGADMLTAGTFGAITSSGLTPPTITISGTPLFSCQIRIAINTTGARGVADFSISFDQGRTWPIKGLKTAAEVFVPSIGITIGFPDSTFYNNNVYTSETSILGWGDKSGNGWHMTAISSQYAVFRPAKGNGKPGLARGAAVTRLSVTGLNIPAPYTLMAVGKLIGQSTRRAIIGNSSAGSGGVLSSETSTTMAYSDGTGTISRTIAANVRRTYFVGVNGASSFLRTDGTSTTGTLANVTLTGMALFSDNPAGLTWDDEIDAWGIWTGILSDDEMNCLAARNKKLWAAT